VSTPRPRSLNADYLIGGLLTSRWVKRRSLAHARDSECYWSGGGDSSNLQAHNNRALCSCQSKLYALRNSWKSAIGRFRSFRWAATRLWIAANENLGHTLKACYQHAKSYFKWTWLATLYCALRAVYVCWNMWLIGTVFAQNWQCDPISSFPKRKRLTITHLGKFMMSCQTRYVLCVMDPAEWSTLKLPWVLCWKTLDPIPSNTDNMRQDWRVYCVWWNNFKQVNILICMVAPNIITALAEWIQKNNIPCDGIISPEADCVPDEEVKKSLVRANSWWVPCLLDDFATLSLSA